MRDERQGTHWAGCWKVHHECAVILLERILASSGWEADCIELGCTEADHTSGRVAAGSMAPATTPRRKGRPGADERSSGEARRPDPEA